MKSHWAFFSDAYFKTLQNMIYLFSYRREKKQTDPEAVTSFLSFWLLSYGIINYKKKQIQDLVSLQES